MGTTTSTAHQAAQKGVLHQSINKQAEDMLFQLIKQLAEREGVTEQLKANNQMEWIARMNNIQSRATEIVKHDIIYN